MVVLTLIFFLYIFSKYAVSCKRLFGVHVLFVVADTAFSTHTSLAIPMSLSCTPVMSSMSSRRVLTGGILALANERKSSEHSPATMSNG